jgi:methionyl-tRNA synthetase
MANKYLITNAIPYVNARPHIGHAMEFVQSDVIARFNRLKGEDVILLCGGDENALKNVQAAEKAGKPVQDFVDENAQYFHEAAEKLNVHFDVWMKGSTPNHHKSSQKLWELCDKAGDIYKKEYKGLYCVGCEQFYEPEELNEKGECFEHPGKKLEEVYESNYFFKLSKYQDQIIELIESEKLKITPEVRRKEILAFVKKGLLDISISRSNERAKNWGVPVPGDDSQRMYVWFDALNIYQSGVGFGWNEKEYKEAWPAQLQVIGKGIIRFHAVYWPAFLLSAGLDLCKGIFVHPYFTVDGQKMSKTLGNVIDPVELIEKYGADAVRYALLRDIPIDQDGDFSVSRLEQLYNAELANELGNLVSRITTIAEKDSIEIGDGLSTGSKDLKYHSEVEFLLEGYQFNVAIERIWQEVRQLNKSVNDFEPWKKSPDERKDFLTNALKQIHSIAYMLQPIIPDTAEKILAATQGKISKVPPLFPRI